MRTYENIPLSTVWRGNVLESLGLTKNQNKGYFQIEESPNQWFIAHSFNNTENCRMVYSCCLMNRIGLCGEF